MQPTNPNNKTRPYTCPTCKRSLVLLTEFYGIERERIDEKTGEPVARVSIERGSVQNQVLECSNHNCDWEAPWLDFEDEE